MNDALRDILDISHAVGGDPQLTQGGGGNASVKTGDGYMYLKASGTALKNMSARKGWRRLQVARVLEMLEDKALPRQEMVGREKEVARRLIDCCEDSFGPGVAPSIEAPTHAMLRRCTLHIHPVAVGPYISSRNGREAAEELFSDEMVPLLWVPCADTGHMTGCKINTLLRKYRRAHGQIPSILFVQKHGLFVSAETPSGVYRLVRKVVNRCGKSLKQHGRARRIKQPGQDEANRVRLAIRRAFAEVAERQVAVRYFFDDTIAAFLALEDAARLLRIAPLAPHEIAYAGGSPMWIETGDKRTILGKLMRRAASGQELPATFLVKGVGLFVVAKASKSEMIADVVTASLATRAALDQFGGANSMTKRQRLFTTTIYAYKHS